MKLLEKLSPRERHIATTLFLIITVSLFYNYIAEPLHRRWNSIDSRIRVTKLKLQKSIAILKDKKTIDASYDFYAARLKPSGSDEQEITRMLNAIEVLARRSGVRVANMKPKTPKEESFYKLFVVEIDTESSMSSLMKFIYNARQSKQLLKVDKMNINARGTKNANSIKASILISRISLK